MPASKEPPEKTSSKPPRKKAKPAEAGGALPDRAAMESYLATTAAPDRKAALSKAQDMIYEAWEVAAPRSRIALARQALALSPLCADAYHLLAGEAANAAEARDLYARGVEAAELALGPEVFDNYGGHFWGVLETRPYMRARHGLAMALLKLGEEEAAIGHMRALLKLNPGDNQGVRYLLLGLLLRRDDMAGVKKLLAAYKEEWSAYWLYTRALVAFRAGRGAAKPTVALARDAYSSNAHVLGILTGAEPLVTGERGYIMAGGADEASEYVRECGWAWRETLGAIAWLNEVVAATPRKPH